MPKIWAITIAAVLAITSLGCRAAPTATPVPPTATAVPTNTAVPTPTSTPTETPTPTPEVYPTASTPAPEEPFVEIAWQAEMAGEGGVAGTATVAGLQTIVIRGFTYDGSCERAEIRLALAASPDVRVATLLLLEKRAYQDEILVLTVPNDVTPGGADSIEVYCLSSGEVLGSGLFEP